MTRHTESLFLTVKHAHELEHPQDTQHAHPLSLLHRIPKVRKRRAALAAQTRIRPGSLHLTPSNFAKSVFPYATAGRVHARSIIFGELGSRVLADERFDPFDHQLDTPNGDISALPVIHAVAIVQPCQNVGVDGVAVRSPEVVVQVREALGLITTRYCDVGTCSCLQHPGLERLIDCCGHGIGFRPMPE